MASSINQAAALQNLGFKRGTHVAEAFEFSPGLHKDVFGNPQAPQATARALGTAHGCLVAVAHHDEQIQVAAFVRLSSGV
ncbi:MAG: hypothetical protein KIT22_12270 [Verrucomicrobiae bacterium]|nr:hypothetical protein [Verrucomicrobiae bacterium]